VCGTLSAVKKNHKKKPVTDQAGVDWLAGNVKDEYDREQLNRFAEYKKVRDQLKFLSSLPGHRDPEGRLHCVLAPETDTGRLSCRNPNLQQIPKSDRYGIRAAFRAEEGFKLIVADYSQLELYVLAHFLIELFDDHGLANALKEGDVHSAVAKMAWPELQKFPGKLDVDLGTPAWAAKKRSDVKSVVYGLNYGKTARGLGVQIKDEDGRAIGTERAQELLDTVCEALGVRPYQEYIQAYATKHGGVHTLLGRWRPLPGAQSDDEYERSAALRQALNTPIQGSAVDIVTGAMLRLNTDPLPELRRAGWYSERLATTGSKLLLQAHDELVFEVPREHAEEARELVQWGMEHPFKEGFLKVPLKVEAKVADNWAEGK
jgi:DNA polymerase-1